MQQEAARKLPEFQTFNGLNSIISQKTEVFMTSLLVNFHLNSDEIYRSSEELPLVLRLYSGLQVLQHNASTGEAGFTSVCLQDHRINSFPQFCTGRLRRSPPNFVGVFIK
jgi:hypothetical protein